MLRRTLSLSLLLAASAATAQDRTAVSPPNADRTISCPAGACTSSATLDLSSSSSVEVASWSWGVSQSTSARDAGSGMATGKRQHQPVARGGGKVSVSDISMTKRSAPSSSSSSSTCSADAPCPGGGTVSVKLAASRKGWDGCVKGSHIASAQLRSGSSSFHLTDVTVQACDVAAGTMSLSYASLSESPSPSTR